VPVLVLTASREPHLRSRAFELGARAFLTKPVLESALVQALRAAQT
jgi:CheY-like chemotaxis protein